MYFIIYYNHKVCTLVFTIPKSIVRGYHHQVAIRETKIPLEQFIWYLQILEPKVKNIPVDCERLRRFQIELERALNRMENNFLQASEYLCGTDDITIADILAACELMQPVAASYDISKGRPLLSAWMDRVKTRLEPHFQQVHGIISKPLDLRGHFYQCESFDAA